MSVELRAEFDTRLPAASEIRDAKGAETPPRKNGQESLRRNKTTTCRG
jgi:hypothetical protein